jgi:hypothetical protein
MKHLLPPPKAVFPRTPEISNPSEAGRRSAAPASHKAQTISKNPVVLALHGIDQSRPDADGQATDRLRIANEILQHIGGPSAPASNGSDCSIVQAFREQCSREQVSRMRAELEAYLGQLRREEAFQAPHPRHDDMRRPRDMTLHNPVLAALNGRWV